MNQFPVEKGLNVNYCNMKHLLLIFSLLLTSISWSKEVDSGDLVERDGLVYEKFSDIPFTGKSTGRKQGKVKKGKWDGEYRSYWKSGQLGAKVYYKNGKKEGEYLYYHENGQLWIKGYYKDDEQEGKQLQYDKSGKLITTIIYKDGNAIDAIKH